MLEGVLNQILSGHTDLIATLSEVRRVLVDLVSEPDQLVPCARQLDAGGMRCHILDLPYALGSECATLRVGRDPLLPVLVSLYTDVQGLAFLSVFLYNA